jgi:pSer/pThr/pTyr-binding forkhead associated (FHA) protein
MVRSLRIGHRRFVLSPGVNTIGREPNCTVCINDASVSRGHARITITDNDVLIEDLKSKNGTQVMGELNRRADTAQGWRRARVRSRQGLVHHRSVGGSADDDSHVK